MRAGSGQRLPYVQLDPLILRARLYHRAADLICSNPSGPPIVLADILASRVAEPTKMLGSSLLENHADKTCVTVVNRVRWWKTYGI